MNVEFGSLPPWEREAQDDDPWAGDYGVQKIERGDRSARQAQEAAAARRVLDDIVQIPTDPEDIRIIEDFMRHNMGMSEQEIEATFAAYGFKKISD